MTAIAHTFIGVKVDNKKIKAYQTVVSSGPGCVHVFPQDAKFCPECGAGKIAVNVNEEAHNFEQDVNRSSLYITWGSDGRATFVTKRKFHLESEDIEGCGGWEMMDIPSNEQVADLKAELKAFLEPKGLWEEAKFGIWCVGQGLY
jgi:hypothetical protein